MDENTSPQNNQNLIPSMYSLKINSPKESTNRFGAKIQKTPSFHLDQAKNNDSPGDKPISLFNILAKKPSPSKINGNSYKARIAQKILSTIEDIPKKPDPTQDPSEMIEQCFTVHKQSPIKNKELFPTLSDIAPNSSNTNDTSESGSQNKGKRKLFDNDFAFNSSEFKDENHDELLIPRKLFVGNEFSEGPVTPTQGGSKSPNIRARCLMNDKMFEGKFAFTLKIPNQNQQSPSKNDILNPFKEISVMQRLPSEMDISRCDSVTTPSNNFDFSKSPVVMMRNSSINMSQVPEDVSRMSEDLLERPLKRADSNFSQSLDQELRFDKEFDVVSEIGKGHFGVVKRCRNKLDGLEYAVKITKHKWRGDRGKQEALQEVFALSALSVCDDNPYIVKYFNGWIEDSKLYIVVFFY